jgi:hypothetical protein
MTKKQNVNVLIDQNIDGAFQVYALDENREISAEINRLTCWRDILNIIEEAGDDGTTLEDITEKKNRMISILKAHKYKVTDLGIQYYN